MVHRSRLGVLVALLSLLSVLGSGLPAGAQNKPPETIFSCLPDTAAAPVYEIQEISCILTGPNGNVVGEDILGEILEDSVSDTDGTTSPPDLSGLTDENGTISFEFEGLGAGTDTLCFWYEANNVPDDINEGDNQCVDDGNSEVVIFEWSAPDQAPALKVTSEGLSPTKAKLLMEGFGLSPKLFNKTDPLDKDGALLYVDDKRFQRIPSAPMDGDPAPEEDGEEVSLDGILIGMLKGLDPISDKTARNRTERAFGRLQGAQVDYFTPRGGQTRLFAENGEFELLPAVQPDELQRIQRSESADFQTGSFEIDTTVSWEQTFKGIPLKGPGANFRASFDPSGKVSMLNLAAREVKLGKEIPIMNEVSALDACQAEVEESPQTKSAAAVDLNVELVYYAPPLDTSVKKIYPHYECTATMEAEGIEFDVRPFSIPAPVFDLPPRIDIDISAEGPTVTAAAVVEGGAPPYRYSWNSVFNEIPEGVSTTGPSVVYDAVNRGEEFLDYEIVMLVVTDSEGLSATDYALVRVSPLTSDILAETRGISFGASYVGGGYAEGSRLRHPDANSRGFRDTLNAAGVEHNYFLGDRSVFESDFSDTEVKPSGSDEVWADNTDMFWFTGHANGDGFLLWEGADSDDAFVGFNDVRWGDRDLEFATIAACGPLQDMASGLTLQARWGPVFQGLHILNGYSTVSQDGTEEGRTFAQHLVGTGDLVPRYVRHAWSLAAIAVQPPDVIHGSMGVVSTSGASSISDYFWGFGRVSPDIRGGDIAGFWVLRYPS